jgi:hypothetical protein
MPAEKNLPPDTPQRGGFYSSEFRSDIGVWGYSPKPDKADMGPSCVPHGHRFNVNGISADEKGNLVVPGSEDPDGTMWTVDVYQGAAEPHICGKLLGKIPITAGQPVDAFSFDAAKLPIVVSVIDSTTHLGEIVKCSLAKLSCEAPVTSPAITGYSAGIAEARNEDCWLATAKRVDVGVPAGFRLVWFPHCHAQKAMVVTGTTFQSFYGGLFIDESKNKEGKGNRLGSFDAFDGVLHVYTGCKPACVEYGREKLAGQSFFGGLNGASNRLAVGDATNGSVDVYRYDAEHHFKDFGLLYSFNGGLERSRLVMSGIFSPSDQRQHHIKH